MIDTKAYNLAKLNRLKEDMDAQMNIHKQNELLCKQSWCEYLKSKQKFHQFRISNALANGKRFQVNHIRCIYEVVSVDGVVDFIERHKINLQTVNIQTLYNITPYLLLTLRKFGTDKTTQVEIPYDRILGYCDVFVDINDCEF